MPLSYYPPRSDLTTFTSLDGSDPPTFAAINDLDAVAAATPPYGAVYNRTWPVPSTLPPGDYALMVEVNKEYDSNASHLHPDFVDSNLPDYGTDGNFGQPSVVYQVPIHIDVTSGTTDAQSTSQIIGYGDWTGATGVINPRDATISTSSPGSGEARLLVISDSSSGLSGRVLATHREQPCLDDPAPERGHGSDGAGRGSPRPGRPRCSSRGRSRTAGRSRNTKSATRPDR